ncbi:MAG: transporter associated domain-containing protein [Verrucomicrobiales bacterium]|nr:transporter associated domain-containing protein [Verrucomicrobiales bacterium]
MSPAPTISLLVALGAFSALISALEATVSSLRHHQLMVLSGSPEPPRVQRAAELVLGSPKTVLLAILLSGALLNLSIVALAVYLVLEFATAAGFSPLPAALALFAILVIAADAAPKSLALAHPKDTFRNLSPVLLSLYPPLYLGARLIARLNSLLVNRLSLKRISSRGLLTGDELGTWIEMRRDLGTLDPSESAIIQEIIRLRSKIAKDFITPRIDTFTLDLSTTADLALRLVRVQTHWQVPVYDTNPDAIVGVLDVKALLIAGTDTEIKQHVRPPVFVPGTMKATTLFKEHLSTPHSLVVVLDEYGGFEGIVTHTDILEEIIEDAAPLPGHQAEIQYLDDGSMLVSGAARLDEISSELSLDLEEDGLDTIGGLVFTTAGHLPDQGETVTLSHGVAADVREVSQNRIQLIVLKIPDDEPPRAVARDQPT